MLFMSGGLEWYFIILQIHIAKELQIQFNIMYS